MKVGAIVVAAGSGERLGADRPKAFVVLAGRPMIEWSLDALAAAEIGTAAVAVALPEGWAAPAGTVGVRGGATRSESVRNALAALGDVDAVVVHDAARPLVAPALFTRCLAALEEADAAIAAARVTDTVKRAAPGGDVVAETLDRSALWAVQTPQAFRAEVLRRALAQPDTILRAATDDASLVEGLGGTVRLVEATEPNLKVTVPVDLDVAALLLERRASYPRRPC